MKSRNVLHSTATAPPASSPTTATDKPQASHPPAPRLAHKDWKRKAIQDMNGLVTDPDLALALRKRGF